MKKYKLIMPIIGLTSIATAAMPLASCNKTPVITPKTIVIKTEATTKKFKKGETFSSAGLVLIVTYSDETTKEVSTGFTTDYDGKTFTNADAGTGKTVTVTYEENGVKQTTTYTIDVVATVSITFTAGTGGTLSGETQVEVEKGTAWNEINKPTPNPDQGYRIMGWYDKNDHWWKSTDTTPVEEDLSVEYWFASYSGEITITHFVIPEQEQFQVDYARGTGTWKEFKDYYKLEDPKITGRTFLGWYCGNTKLEDNSQPFTTTEITIHARFTADFATDTWENVVWACNQGFDFAKTVYGKSSFIGLTRNITLFGQQYEVRVIGEKHDTLVDGTTPAALTFELSSNVVCDQNGDALLTKYAGSGSTTVMNRELFVNLNTESPVVWYTKQGISSTCTTSCLTALKAENSGLVPKQVKKATATLKDSSTKTYELESYNTYLFPLTSVELGIDCTAEVEKTEGTKYDYWTGKEASTRVKSDRNGNNVHYWIASQYQQDVSSKSIEAAQVILGTEYTSISAGNKYAGMNSSLDTRFGYSSRFAVSFAFCI